MPPMLTITTARADHIEPLARFMRARDRQEIWLASRATPIQALRDSLDRSAQAWTLCDGQDPLCMFGVAPATPNANTASTLGIVWLLATDEVMNHQMTFLRLSRFYIALMNQSFATMVNYVDADNKTSINWLKWLGFEIMPPQPYGPFNHPFHFFSRSHYV